MINCTQTLLSYASSTISRRQSDHKRNGQFHAMWSLQCSICLKRLVTILPAMRRSQWINAKTCACEDINVMMGFKNIRKCPAVCESSDINSIKVLIYLPIMMLLVPLMWHSGMCLFNFPKGPCCCCTLLTYSSSTSLSSAFCHCGANVRLQSTEF